jgi:hypothetical protein
MQLYALTCNASMYSKTSIICITWSTCNITIALRHYVTAKNAQVDAILMKTGLNNVLLPTLFIAVNNIEQYCYTRFRLNNIVQYCWQVWTTWAAKHCSILLSSGLGVFCCVIYIPMIYTGKNWSCCSALFKQYRTMLFCTPWTISVNKLFNHQYSCKLLTWLSTLTSCNNIDVQQLVNNIVHGVQHNIVRSCFEQLAWTWYFYACMLHA